MAEQDAPASAAISPIARLIESHSIPKRMLGYVAKLVAEGIFVAAILAIFAPLVLLFIEGTGPFKDGWSSLATTYKVAAVVLWSIFLASVWCITSNPDWRPGAPRRG